MIKCPVCPWVPPQQKKGEDYIWYGYRKWRACAEHIVSAHCRDAALTHRRIASAEARMKQQQKPGKPN